MGQVVNLRTTASRGTKLNVLGAAIDVCSCEPVTGWFRDGNCNTADDDHGHHVICAVMTAEFLDYSKSAGNDLSTPNPENGFPGLKPGDHWCLCALRWKQAHEAGRAPPVVLESTHQSVLSVVSLGELQPYALN